MKDFNINGILDLTQEEAIIISAGDPFMRDLFKSFGILCGWAANAAEWAWYESTKPAPGDNSALLQTNVVTLFN